MSLLAFTPGEADQRPRNRQGSGQGLLLVMLGEFVWRRRETAWSSALVAALSELGISENAARKALHRSTQSGIIKLRRDGRRAECSISGAGSQMLERGDERVFGFHGESPDWDGRWLVVTVSVPETQRNARHHLRTRFMWAGLGSPTPGVWITPRTDTSVGAILSGLGLEKDACSYVGTFGPVGRESAMVNAAWDIKGLERLYRDFIEEFSALRPRAGSETFCAYVNLLQAWRQFPYLDPQLPRQFLPNPWVGRRAAKLLHQRRALWSAGANEFWGKIQLAHRD